MGNMNTKQKIVFIGMFAIMIATITYYFFTNEQKEYETINESDIVYQENYEGEKDIIVHITGSIAEEGIVKLKEGDRIADAIEKAGGVTADANIKNVNLAYKLKDGQKIYIPSNIDDSENIAIVSSKGEGVISDNGKKGDKVNINEATQTELETLPGIGPSMAAKILEYREKNGEFNSIEDIKNVTGIGNSKYETIKDNICVD